MKRFVYADNAATTPVSRKVIDAMMPIFEQSWGNPSSQHSMGIEAKDILDDARARIADVLGCSAGEIYFTSGGTESDNWGIRGAAMRMKKKGRTQIITSKIEHHAVLHTCEALEKEGFTVDYLNVDEYGVVKLDELRSLVGENTAVVAIMYANNEIGTIQPIDEIVEIAHSAGALVFTDAVQAVGNIDVDLSKTRVDMLALSGHKLHAPKGVGALYVRRGVRFRPFIVGGHQERGRRAGTENVASIVGLGKAAELAYNGIAEENTRVKAMRDRLEENLLKLPATRLNGDPEHRLPNTTNISFEFIEGESILMLLDMFKICASSGSACTTGSLEPSHVLRAMGVPYTAAHGAIRFSFSRYNTEADVDFVLEKLPPVIARLREISPYWKG